MDPCAPVYIHIAEQQREVDDCLAWSGTRPVVRWLLDHARRSTIAGASVHANAIWTWDRTPAGA